MRMMLWAGLLGVVVCCVSMQGQVGAIGAGERVDADEALVRALKSSSLTYEGKPFHTVVEIASPEAGPDYSGRVEVWWADRTKYKATVQSPKFSQEKVVNGDSVSEKDKGDYYPRWLENFALAVLDPVPVAKNFQGSGGVVMVGDRITSSCLRRDDRPGGITDQMTWGMVCFSGAEPRIASILTTNISFELKDWKGFGKKKVARTIQTDVLDYKPVVGRVTVLEDLLPEDGMFAVPGVTPSEKRIATEYVSTLTEEGMVESVPKIEWPAVREGKTEGYMIVYARTDRTGQVRETAKHNSDNARLEQFGMEQALKYKFRPLVVDGVAEQMEMPLVLHFTSRLEDPLPVLSVEEMKKQIIRCDAGHVPSGTPKGAVITFQVSINEAGKIAGLSGPRGPFGSGDQTVWRPVVSHIFQTCRFAPYTTNGKATYYKGQIELTAP